MVTLVAVRRDDDLLRGGVGVVGRLGDFCVREKVAPAGDPTQARRDAAGGLLRVLRALSAGALSSPTSMPSKGFALPVRCTNTGAVDVPVFSM